MSNRGEHPPIHWWRFTPYVALHALALGVFFQAWSWRCLAVFGVTYFAKVWGVGAGYHRLFTHRAFATSRAGQFLFALLGSLAMQNGPLWWTAHHRAHHRFSDRPGDPHSPREGFWWAQVLWIFAHRDFDTEEVKDLIRFRELVWLDRFNQIPALALGAFLAFHWGLPEFLWGFAASTVACWHTTSAVNSLGHLRGARPYATGDLSANHAVLALLTLGEGWHNNHHRFSGSARHGFKPWEIDLTYCSLLALGALGLVWDLRPVPDSVSEEVTSIPARVLH